MSNFDFWIFTGVFASIAIGLWLSPLYKKLGSHVESWCDKQDEKKRSLSQ